MSGKIRDALQSTVVPGADTQELGNGLTSYRWLSYRTLWLTTSEGVVVFDPLNRAASADIAAHLKEGGQPLRYVIYSHGHRDHVSGADALGGHPIVLAHRRTAEDIRVRGYSDVVAPTETFDEDEHVLEIGGEEIRLIRLAGAHTDALVASYFPRRRLLYAVDLVWPGQLPPPGAPLSYSGVERALDRLLQLDFDTFVPGHGAIVKRQEVIRYRTFLSDLRKEFVAALQRRGLNDLHSASTFLAAPEQLGSVFFEVIDALKPTYGDWENYDAAILPTVQWCFWSVLTGD
ncbi:MAG: MBL fold metallo-hydrolase [Hyalangium sp.]|uniref:MBL fold metallo-hydrolase n=1 Tax=Hyalangium sp. TaxID=2028555 RepID=UPI003899A086